MSYVNMNVNIVADGSADMGTHIVIRYTVNEQQNHYSSSKDHKKFGKMSKTEQ